MSFGPALTRMCPGHQYQTNIRTVARKHYTELLLATRPWADGEDLQIFLMGFDAGEQFASCSNGSRART